MVAIVKRFLHFQPGVGTHFQSKVKKDQAEDIPDNGVESESVEEKQTTMYEMHRKTLSKAMLNHEIIKEMNERKMTYKFEVMKPTNTKTAQKHVQTEAASL